MIPLILSIAVFCFVIDAHAGWHEEKSTKSFFKGLGVIVASGVILLGSCSVLETKPAARSWAFRTGELIPVVYESDNEGWETNVEYRQKSWWGWRKDGQWPARPDTSGGWEYWNDKTWRAVPMEIYDSSSDERNMEVDNRGWHEQ